MRFINLIKTIGADMNPITRTILIALAAICLLPMYLTGYFKDINTNDLYANETD